MLGLLWAACVAFKIFVLAPGFYFRIESWFLWAVEEGTPAFRFDYQWRKGNNRRDAKVITLFHPGFVAIAAEEDEVLAEDEEETDKDAVAKEGLTRKNVAFLMTYSLLIEWSMQGLIGQSVAFPNNQGSAGWGYWSEDMCCSYSYISFFWSVPLLCNGR